MCQSLLKLLIALTQTQKRTIYHCVGYWQAYLDYISSRIPKIHLLTREEQKTLDQNRMGENGRLNCAERSTTGQHGRRKQQAEEHQGDKQHITKLKYNKTIPIAVVQRNAAVLSAVELKKFLFIFFFFW